MMLKLFKSGNRRRKSSASVAQARPTFLETYTLSSMVLGKGNFAVVKPGKENGTNRSVAVKIIDKSTAKPSHLVKAEKEVNILLKIRHPNIVQVHTYFNEEDFFYVVMEHVNGRDLFVQIVHQKVKFTEAEAKRIISSVLQALQYCWTKGIVHRDVKPDNILMTSPEEGSIVKLADFNLAKQVDHDVNNWTMLETLCGTPAYIAPEILCCLPYNYKCDIWSVGVFSFILLSGGYQPFAINPAKEREKDLFRKIKLGFWKFLPRDIWKNVSDTAKDAVMKMLKTEPEERPSYEQLFEHEWFTEPANASSSGNISLDALESLNENRREASKRKLMAVVTTYAASKALADLADDTVPDFSNQTFGGFLD